MVLGIRRDSQLARIDDGDQVVLPGKWNMFRMHDFRRHQEPCFFGGEATGTRGVPGASGSGGTGQGARGPSSGTPAGKDVLTGEGDEKGGDVAGGEEGGAIFLPMGGSETRGLSEEGEGGVPSRTGGQRRGAGCKRLFERSWIRGVRLVTDGGVVPRG